MNQESIKSDSRTDNFQRLFTSILLSFKSTTRNTRKQLYVIFLHVLLPDQIQNMINKINKERRRSTNPHMTQQQEPMARSPGGPQTKTGQGKDRARTGQSLKDK
jgi:hypothetical protein